MHKDLRPYGWSRHFERELAALADPELRPGRVVATHRGAIHLWTTDGGRQARVAGRLLHPDREPAGRPVVGDWVAYESPGAAEPVTIRDILRRRSRLARSAAGRRTERQVVAANVDLALVVMGLDGDYNPRRLERFLAMIEERGARPAVLLNKLDLEPDIGARMAEIRGLAGAAPVLAISAAGGPLDAVELLLTAGETVALVGSSGAGKTTLINRLLGDGVLPTGPVREHDSRGRHTTTHRELFLLPSGAMVIDNPGTREIQPWSAGQALPRVFAEIEELARSCRFSGCAHQVEPGCAVRRAIADGTLEAGRLAGWHRLERESDALERRKDVRRRRERDKRLSKLYKSVQRQKRENRS